MTVKCRLTTAKPVYIPMLPGEILSHDQLPFTPAQHAEMSKVPYRKIIGHVVWPVMISRPDAVFATGILSQFISNPGPTHTKALIHLITYLYMMRDCWLMFGGKDAEIITYMDADYAQESDCNLILGYCLQFGVWRNKILLLSHWLKLNMLATLTVKEIMWIQNFWMEINRKSIINPPLLKADNQGAIKLSNNNKFHVHTKHIDVHYHFICEVMMSEQPKDFQHEAFSSVQYPQQHFPYSCHKIPFCCSKCRQGAKSQLQVKWFVFYIPKYRLMNVSLYQMSE